MQYTFTKKSFKIFQVVINLIWLTTGLTYIIIGVLNFLSAYEMEKTLPLSSLNLIPSSIMMMFIGVIIFPIVIIGTYRSYKDGHFISISYAMTLIFVILIQITIAFVLHVDKNNDVTVKKISEDFKDFFGKNFDTVQKKLECCDVNGCSDEGKYVRGCLSVLLDEIKGQKQGLLWLSFGLAIVHSFNLIFAVFIAKDIKNNKTISVKQNNL